MGYRKFTVTLVIACQATWLAYIDKLTPAAATVLAGLAAGYMAVNYARKA